MERVTPHQQHQGLVAQVCEHHREEDRLLRASCAPCNVKGKPVPVIAFWHGFALLRCVANVWPADCAVPSNMCKLLCVPCISATVG